MTSSMGAINCVLAACGDYLTSNSRCLNRFWRPYPHCTFRGPGNVESPQLEMYNIRRSGGGAMASQHEKLQNSHEQAVNAASKGFASGE